MERPVGIDWGELVEHHVRVHGGWAALADELVRQVELAGLHAPDPAAAIKGLRRLAARVQQSGGQYGGWMLRLFGIPSDLEAQLRWLAQYHSRFSDLPTSVRREQLRLWDAPPVSESRLQAWVHVGLASVFLRQQEETACARRLEAALRTATVAGPMAAMETELLAARVAEDAGRRQDSAGHLDRVEAHIDDADPDHVAYRTRLVGQRAYVMTRAGDNAPEALEGARRLFEGIPSDSGVAFVDYKRTAGLAYCTWRLGDAERARELARAAVEHAGDGGFVRFRIMGLNLLARMVDETEAHALRVRARRLAESIEDSYLREVAHRRIQSSSVAYDRDD